MLAQRAQIGAAAARTLARDSVLTAAVMTAQMLGTLMQRQVRIAAAALGHPAAGMAQQRRREAAPVEKQQHLTVAGQMCAHVREQGRRQAFIELLIADIQQMQLWRTGGAGAFRQRQVLITALLRVVQGFQCRRRRAQYDGHLVTVRAPHQ